MTMAEASVTLKLTKPEALALLNAAETGLRLIEALNQSRTSASPRSPCASREQRSERTAGALPAAKAAEGGRAGVFNLDGAAERRDVVGVNTGIARND
jgi:hypothetical protein